MWKVTNKGTTLIEMLISLFIIGITVSLLAGCLTLFRRIEKFDYPLEEEIAFYQLRQILSISSDIQIEPEKLTFLYRGETAYLIIENERLIRKEGYVIYLDNLKWGQFEKQLNCIYLHYERGHGEQKRFLGCKS